MSRFSCRAARMSRDQWGGEQSRGLQVPQIRGAVADAEGWRLAGEQEERAGNAGPGEAAEAKLLLCVNQS